MSELSVSNLWQSAKLREKLIIVIGLAYVFMPFDFIPEIVLGPLGLLDDGGALLAVVITIMGIVNRRKESTTNVIEGEEVTR